MKKIIVFALMALLVLSLSTALVSATGESHTITVHKFNDLDGDGFRDDGEPGIENWEIRLYKVLGDGSLYLWGLANTDSEGTVTFTGLLSGYNYRVWEAGDECWQPTAPTGLEAWEGGYFTVADLTMPPYQAVVEFGNEYTCGEGCTLTPGYWKTHSMYGPAPYDATWAMIGEDTPFFLSGQSYYEVLWTSPSGGNAYYILAHAYIAAELNQLNGASIPDDVLAAWNEATGLFSTYTPDEVAALKGNNGKELRAQFIGLAEILDNYNNGLTGPGHCSE